MAVCRHLVALSRLDRLVTNFFTFTSSTQSFLIIKKQKTIGYMQWDEVLFFICVSLFW